MRYYTAHSYRGSSMSHGFANDTVVLIWDSYEAMTNFLHNYSNISAKRIKKSEATKYATNYSMSTNSEIKPNVFSGEFWGIDEMIEHIDNLGTNVRKFEGLVGELIVCDSDRSHYERFYK